MTIPDDRPSGAVLAGKLRHAMEAAQLRNGDIAEACGVTHQAVSNWKTTGHIKKRHLPALAAVTRFPLAWWLTDGVQGFTMAPPEIDATAFAVEIAEEIRARTITEDTARIVLAVIRALPRSRNGLPQRGALPRIDIDVHAERADDKGATDLRRKDRRHTDEPHTPERRIGDRRHYQPSKGHPNDSNSGQQR